MQKNPDYDLLLKFLIHGPDKAGKSSLLLQYTENEFSDNYISTIGVDFKIRTIQYVGKTIKLQIWDTAGQQRFRTITTSYYRGASAALAVFDLTSQESFARLQEDEKLLLSHNIPIVLVGNKCDLAEKRQIDFGTANAYAESKGWTYIETSAKDKINVDAVFLEAVKAFLSKDVPKPPIDNKEAMGGWWEKKKSQLLEPKKVDPKFPKFNVLVLGDPKVGKTQFVRGYLELQYREEHQDTKQVRAYEKEIRYNKIDYGLHIFDTASRESNLEE